MQTTIIPASTDEQFEFIALHFEETIALWEDYQVTPDSVRKRQAQLQHWRADDKVHLTVAVNAFRQIVGFNSLFIAADYRGTPYGKIVILYVLPEHRGKKIAAELKREGESWLRSRGVKKVITEIDAKNVRMLEINKQAGFRIKSYTLERDLED